MGIPFTIIGGILFYSMLMLLLDPDATIKFNGVPTNDYDKKLFATVFTSLFFIFGLFSLFAPRRWLNKLFIIQVGFQSSMRIKK